MDLKRKVLVALLAVLVVAAFAPGLDAKTRRGALVIITGMDGGRTEGELIAVKPDSLLLMTADGGTNRSISVPSPVKVKKRSKILLSMLIGTAVGSRRWRLGRPRQRRQSARPARRPWT
jgi:hypothetical protein